MVRRKESISFLLVLSIFLQSFSVSAGNPPNIVWQKCFGWTENYGDEGVKITNLPDGNHAIIGKRTFMGVESFWVAKINTKSNILWEMTVFDNDSYTGLRPIDVIGTGDGGVVVAGKITNVDRLIFSGGQGRKYEDAVVNRGHIDNLIFKLDGNGQLVWYKVFGGSGEDSPVKILPTNDGNFLVIGYSNSTDGDLVDTGKDVSNFNRDIWILKLGQGGNLISKKCMGGSGDDMPMDAKKTADGGYIITGNTNSDFGDNTNKGGKDVLIVKLDGNENVSWKKSIGGSQNDEGRGVAQMNNGEYVIGVVSNSLNRDFQFTANNDFPNNFQENIWIVKISGGGDINQKQIFGGSGRDFVNDIQILRSGDILVTGSTNSNNGSITDRNRIGGNNNDKQDFLMLKLDGGLGIQWEKTMGGSSDDEAVSAIESGDGGIIGIGTTKSFEGDVSGNHYGNNENKDIWMMKLGELCDEYRETSQNLVGFAGNVLASDAIKSSDKVDKNSYIRYGANKNVDLVDGFDSENGSTVEVSLYGCNGVSGGVTSNKPIQIKMMNECREGGMKFKFAPFSPDNDMSQYRVSIQNLDPRVPFSFQNNILVTKNNRPDNDKNAFFIVTVSRDGYEDFEFQGYTSTCDHDGNPTECPENNHDLELDKQYYKAGDTFVAKWTGGLNSGQGMQWFTEGISLSFQSDTEARGTINSFPASLQAQPSFSTYPKPCHGAVKVVFKPEK